jgi:dihydroflavonol-4-reductase
MILVTGANGFVGSYLVRYLLKAGEQVTALRRPDSDLSLLGDDAAKIKWLTGDVSDISSLQDAFKGITKIYHTAGITSFQRKDHKQMLKINVEGTANVVNTALDMGIGKLLHVSSVITLGKGKADTVLDESEENIDSDYDSTYALSKCLAEMEVWRGMMEGLNAVIINPSLTIGAEYWETMGPGMIRQGHRGWPFYAKGATGFVDVRDVAKIAIELMNSNITNERFIVSAENMFYRDFNDLIAAEFGKSKRSIPISKTTLYLLSNIELLLARLGNRKPFITPEVIAVFPRIYQYNNQKVKERLNYRFRPIEQTVKETCEAFKKSIADGKKFGTLDL